MLSEDFDKKIRDAADHHHPAYDEKAWSGMKKLLDRHMPEEKDDKRRYFFFLLFFLLLGGGAAWYFLGPGSGERKKEMAGTVQVSATSQKDEPGSGAGGAKDGKSLSPTGNETPEDVTKEEIAADKNDDNHINNKTNGQNEIKKEANERLVANRPVSTDPPEPKVTGKKQPVSQHQVSNKANGENNLTIKTKTTVINDTRVASNENPDKNANPTGAVPKKEETTLVPGVATIQDVRKTGEPDPAQKDVNGITAGDKKPRPEPAQPGDGKKAEEKSIARNRKKSSTGKSSFFFSVSGGPDISFTGNDKWGKTQFVGGVGVGYTYKDRFTLRSGFYSARKVYTSSPEEYNPPSIFYTYYPNLQKVEADCKVYEIPVLLSYHFGAKKQHGWFASAGLSTILMKRETYDYYYKYTPSGPTVHREYTLNDENKHFFSVMTVSAGYQRTLGKRVSVTAEPYFKLPLSGVGYGKVRLNSAGVLFSLSVKPFGKTDKK